MVKTIIIEGQETNYTISDTGEVYNKKTKRKLKGTYKRNEYHSVQLRIGNKVKTVMTHRLVAEAFLPNPDNLPIVHHIDRNKHNNSLENLQWVSIEENVETGIKKRLGEKLYIEPNDEWKILSVSDAYLINRNGQIYNRNRKRIVMGSIRNGYIRIVIIYWFHVKGLLTEFIVIRLIKRLILYQIGH
jgi:hypothetical protein